MWWASKPPWWWRFEYWNKSWKNTPNWFWMTTLKEVEELIKKRTEQIQCQCWFCVYCKERKQKK